MFFAFKGHAIVGIECHADMTLKNHYRPDGSAYHIVDYNPETSKIADYYYLEALLRIGNTHQ